MTTSRVENLPTTWDDTRDEPFFRITARLFSPEFCLGATVLLAGYDEDAPTADGSDAPGSCNTGRTAPGQRPAEASLPSRSSGSIQTTQEPR